MEPQLFHVTNALTPPQCEALVQRAADRLHRAGIYVDSSGKTATSPSRTSWEADLTGPDKTQEIREVEERLSSLVGMPSEHAHPIRVVRYRTGELHSAHLDAFNEKLDPALWAQSGQRIATIVVYLTTVEEGGETFFPVPKVQIRPVAGSAIIFRNVLPNGKADPTALHGSLPVVRGEKWVGVQFFYERPPG